MPDAPPAAPPPKPPEQPQQPPPAPPPPAQPTPTPAPPPAPGTPPTAEAPKNDKVLANIYKTFGMAVDDEFRIAPLSDKERPKDMDLVPPQTTTTPAPATTPGQPPTTAPPSPTTPAQTPTTPPSSPTTQPSLEVKRLATDEILELQRKVRDDLAKFDKRLDELPKPTVPVTPPPPDPSAPDTFEASLPEENRETIELLRWAEENKQEGFKGAAANYVAYLKRLEEFTRTNQDAEDVEEFQQKNKPPITEAAVRKVAREKIKAEAKAEARKEARDELSPELQELRRKQYELEIKPVLAEASREFRLRFGDEKAKLPEGVERIDPVAAREVIEGGEAALKKHKVVAPVLRFHAALADEYMDLALGMKPYDQNNQMHRFLDQFIFHQEQVLLKAPAAKQVRNGKQFLPTIQYQQAYAKNREETEARFWMFSHDDVRRMIEINAHKQVAERRKEIAEAAKGMGFTEPANAPATNTPPAAPPAKSSQNPEPPSPRSAPGKMPGAATNAGIPTQLEQAAGSVYPKELLQTVK